MQCVALWQASTPSAPAAASALDASEPSLRVIARAENSRSGSSRIALTSPPPCAPVAPITAITLLSAIAIPSSVVWSNRWGRGGRGRGGRRLAASGGPRLPRARVDACADEDQDAWQERLPGDGDVQEGDRGDDLLDQHRAEKRADERAASAEDACAAKHDGGDARERVAHPDLGVADADLRGEHEGAERGEQRAEHE